MNVCHLQNDIKWMELMLREQGSKDETLKQQIVQEEEKWRKKFRKKGMYHFEALIQQ